MYVKVLTSLSPQVLNPYPNHRILKLLKSATFIALIINTFFFITVILSYYRTVRRTIVKIQKLLQSLILKELSCMNFADKLSGFYSSAIVRDFIWCSPEHFAAHGFKLVGSLSIHWLLKYFLRVLKLFCGALATAELTMQPYYLT